MRTITIVGGAGGMGQLFKKFWSDFSVNILDKDDWESAKEYLMTADLVVITVPIALTNEIIARVCSFISKDTILADFTSVKVAPITKMLQLHSGSVIGLHPMFGPTTVESSGQILINCGGRDLGNCNWLWDNLHKLKFTIINLAPKEHDKYMSFVQGIEHFTTFTLGTFLKMKDVHPEKMFDIASPIYQMKLLLMGRIFAQDPKLYADIIMADEQRIKLISEYIDYLTLLKSLLIAKDKDSFVQAFEGASKWMGGFTDSAQSITDEVFSKVTYKKT